LEEKHEVVVAVVSSVSLEPTDSLVKLLLGVNDFAPIVRKPWVADCQALDPAARLSVLAIGARGHTLS